MSTSIVIRTTGVRPQGLRRAVGSVLRQTAADVQIIVVGDGFDPTSQLAEITEPRITILQCPKAGRSAAGNAGWAVVATPYMGFLDDDDELLPQHIAQLQAALVATPDAVAAYGSWQQIRVGGSGDDARDGVCRPGAVIPFSRAALWMRNYLPIQAVVFRKSALGTEKPFDEQLDALEDWDLWLRLSRCGEFVAVPECTSRYRISSDKRLLLDRAAIHEIARGYLAKKHDKSGVVLRFDEFSQLESYIRNHLDDFAGARYSLGRLWRRLRLGH